ncbi:MAG TPA: SufD family Fe-S cluster assembly protein [Thermoplasmata archaeon]|nr:SufD family Fe-S cluster assembly protein [Thermoplasmata archaeon]
MAAAIPRYEEWLPLARVEELGRSLSDPHEFHQIRLDAHSRFLSLPLEPNPLYRGYGYFSGVDLTGIDPKVDGSSISLPSPIPGALRVVHDVSGTRVELPGTLKDAGVSVRTLAEIWTQGGTATREFLRGSEDPVDRLSALATATLNRGYRLDVPDGCRIPVRVQEITALSVPHEALSLRRSIHAGTGSQLLVTEEVFSTPNGHAGQRLYASSVDLDLGADTKVVYLGVHAPDLKAVSVYRRTATTGPRSRLAWVWNGLGGYRTKIRNHTQLSGEASAVLDLQSFYGMKDQSYDSSIDLTHVATDTHGQSITRGVFSDEARGMSRGLVRIEHQARKTISIISEHAMLLSKGARSDTIPILEILCRDVKATHSTSVAPVDAEKVFYLESRGIPPADSIRMIGEGFLSYVLERAPVAGLREILYPALAARWEGGDLSWAEGKYPNLPALDVTGTEAAPEWRFDSKMR